MVDFSWVPKNWCLRPAVLGKTLESPLDSKEIKPVHPKGNQPWIFIGRTDAEAPILWPSDARSWFIGKDSDAGKDWRTEETAMTEDEMVGWHHQLNGHEFEQRPGDGEGQGCLAWCTHVVAKIWIQLSNWTIAIETNSEVNEILDWFLFLRCSAMSILLQTK